MDVAMPVLVIALVSALAVVGWLRWRLRIVTVYGMSMHPTFRDGDRVLVRRTRLSRVRTGDIVVLDDPQRPDPGAGPLPGAALGRAPGAWVYDQRLIIKRAAAVAGDPVPAPVAQAVAAPAGSPVRDGALVVLGDNPDASLDSRTFGYVSEGNLLGVVVRPMHTTRARERGTAR